MICVHQVTPRTRGKNNKNWVVMCGTNQGKHVYVNGTNIATQDVSGWVHHGAPIYVNDGNRYLHVNNARRTDEKVDPSDWAVAEVITWNRGLSGCEMKQVSKYLLNLLKTGTPSASVPALPPAVTLTEHVEVVEFPNTVCPPWTSSIADQKTCRALAEANGMTWKGALENDLQWISGCFQSHEKKGHPKDSSKSVYYNLRPNASVGHIGGHRLCRVAAPTGLQKGMVAWFKSSQANATWTSSGGSGNHTGKVTGGCVKVATAKGYLAQKPIRFIQGSASSLYKFGPIIHADFSICSISRYTGKSSPDYDRSSPLYSIKYGTVLTSGRQSDWYHGHTKKWSGMATYGRTLRGYPQTWRRTPVSPAQGFKREDQDWTIMCSTNKAARTYIWGNPQSAMNPGGYGGVESLQINYGHSQLDGSSPQTRNIPRNGSTPVQYVRDGPLWRKHKYSQTSEWAVAEVLTWNRELSDNEMKEVSRYLGSVLNNTVCCGGDTGSDLTNAKTAQEDFERRCPGNSMAMNWLRCCVLANGRFS